MKASDYIVSYLEKRGVDTIFGYQGGMITHLVDSIARNSKMRFVQTYHEQTAALAAEGYARETGKIGVAISTSGPGATNMLTGIANAWFDSIPVIYITGQVNTYEYKFDKPIRQLGFQETDIVTMVQGITKYATMITDANEISYTLEKAYYLANNGRKGPVLIDLPMDISRAEINLALQREYTPPQIATRAVDFSPIIDILAESRRPLIIAGGGVVSSGCQTDLALFARQHRIPTICSLMGKGAMDETDELFLGMLGSYGNRNANMTVANADLLIVLGSRLDTRQTGARIEGFLSKGAKIVHIDIDNDELEQHRLSDKLNFNADLPLFFRWLSGQQVPTPDRAEWLRYTTRLKEKYSQTNEVERFVANKSPYHFLQQIDQYAMPTDVFCVDIGQNQMWAAQTLQIKPLQQFFTSGGLAPMGYCLPAAIGAAFGNPDKNIWALCGDGGFHIAIQSLMLISQYDLNIKTVVFNNESLGMITQFQELYFDNLMAGTTAEGGYLVPSISDLAKAYNLPYYCLHVDDLTNESLLLEVFGQRNVVIEYRTNGLTKVSPKLEFDKHISRPSPQLTEEENIQNASVDLTISN